MKTLTTILGMLPMDVSHGVGAEMWRPLGISIIGGPTIGTLRARKVVVRFVQEKKNR